MKIKETSEIRTSKVMQWLKEHLPDDFYPLHRPREFEWQPPSSLIYILRDEEVEVKRWRKKPVKEIHPVEHANLRANYDDIYCYNKDLIPLLKELGDVFELTELYDWSTYPPSVYNKNVSTLNPDKIVVVSS